jgi:hypothetical protein
MTSSALVQFDPELVHDRELRFVSLAMGASSVSDIESWTVLPPNPKERPWDLVGFLVMDSGGWVAIFSRPRARRDAPGCDWSDLRTALAEAFMEGARTARAHKGDFSKLVGFAAAYAEEKHRAVGE